MPLRPPRSSISRLRNGRCTHHGREQALGPFVGVRHGDGYSHELTKDEIAAADIWDATVKHKKCRRQASASGEEF